MNSSNDLLTQIEIHLQNKQVYFRKEITDVNLKTIMQGERVHDVSTVNVERLNESCIAFTVHSGDKQFTLYENKSDKELFEWVKWNFIPVFELINTYLTAKNIKKNVQARVLHTTKQISHS